ncbi:hypothetical protein IFM89_002400 [Coptis chinensis]|uniref:C2 NT-type domain-containing protein n=1 Tax=Coptis chinensis TaxID=261450 RepID=A0A835IIV5_9MAGN|nr:hypothetical protein IFM89_002400 [Coptis chinensis]
MAGEIAGKRNSSNQLLDELETLSQSIYQPNTSTTRGRRTNSLALPRDAVPTASSIDSIATAKIEGTHERPRARRMSMSPWRSRPKLDDENEQNDRAKVSSRQEIRADDKASSGDKQGIWNWKPIRAISHIRMQKLSCLFSVEVVTIQGLPASMNGLRLSVCVRKKETKDGAVQTMPARVLQGAADFEETLFLRCHLYCTSGSSKQLKFEPRPFLIYAFAVDAEELEFGRNYVDLSLLVQESMAKNLEGMRVRQWDTSYFLSGKAKGGELVLKLGFQIMEKDGGIRIYSRAEGLKSGKGGDSSSSFARKQSKSSFSVSSPRLTSRTEVSTPSKTWAQADLRGIDDLNLDEPAPVHSTSSSIQKSEEPEPKVEEVDFPEFEIVDKGVEIQDKTDGEDGDSEHATDERSVSSEVVKEVVQDPVHLTRLTELDTIAQQIKALESMMGDESSVKTDGTESERLDADEENVTMEFLQMLEEEESEKKKVDQQDVLSIKSEATEEESYVFLPDLGKGLGSVVQTKNGGYLAVMNPFNVEVSRKETPKLAMQLSKPLILPSQGSMSGFEVLQRMASVGIEELSSEILSSMLIDELIGKTAEQIAFEGIASAIIQGRNKEGASSSAARTIEAVKTMATTMSTSRKQRISSGIWYIREEPVTLDEMLAFSMQKIEAMAVEALKIQAEMAEEDAPFDVSPLVGMKGNTGVKDPNRPLAAGVPLEDWLRDGSTTILDSEEDVQPTITVSVVVQLRDPVRRYEAVGGPVVVLIQATRAEATQAKDDEERFKVVSLHVGGLKVWTAGKRHVWDAEKQRLTAMQWLVAYGLGKPGKKGKYGHTKGPDMLWSISSRVMADMWLKSMRNPDVKFHKQQV